MNKRPRYWPSKNQKISQKSHIIQYGGQTVRLTAKSDKKQNIPQKISFPHSGLRFLIRPTVCPQFTKIGGSEGGPEKKFRKFFYCVFSAFGTSQNYLTKKISEILTLSGSECTCVLMGSPIQVLTRPYVA